MAKSPGPAIAMAAAAALFLLSRGSDDSDDTPEKEWEPPAPEDDGTTTTETGEDKPDTGGTGGSTGEDPPNVSNDPAGYNTNLWTSPRAVRSAMIQLGYPMTLSNTPVVKNALMESFQRHYNWVSANPDVVLGSGPFTAHDLGPKQSGIGSIESLPPGNILMDGTAGKNTLNALEVALKKTSLWKDYISSAGPDYPSGGSSGDGSGGDWGDGSGGDWGAANGPCSFSFSSDHGAVTNIKAHQGLSDASAGLLKEALESKFPYSGQTLRLTTKRGARLASEPNGPDIIPHTHEMVFDEDELKALSRGESVTITTSGPSDDDDNHTHTVTVSNC